MSWTGLLILLGGLWIVVILVRGLIQLFNWMYEEFVVAPREEKRIQQLRRARRQARRAEESAKQSSP